MIKKLEKADAVLFGEEHNDPISVAEQSDIQKLDDANKKAADFIICVPKDMTKTY